MTSPATASGIPSDYYNRLADVDESHWWYQGMHAISRAMLGERLRPGLRVLDAGCGTGGFLRFLLEECRFSTAAGVDIGSAAIALARRRVPEADLRVAPLRALPFTDESFDLVVTNDVLQHVPEEDVAASLRELRRVLATEGSLLVRTNGSRRLRRERSDWRAYDRATLRRELEVAGFVVERLTYANAALSLLAAARGRVPHAPSEERHGIPAGTTGGLAAAVGRSTLRAEARWIESGRALPSGHTLFALASPP